MERAQVIVTGELVTARGGLEASELAKLLKVSVERAEELLSAVQVDRLLDGRERLRVEEPSRLPDQDSEADEAHAKRARE